MSVSNFARRLRTSESGNVIAIVAGLMPLLMGSAALAVDATQLALWKRQLQRTADSAAIAGAYSYAQNDDEDGINEEEIDEGIDNDIDENPHPPILTKEVTAGPQAGFQEAVRVALTSRRTLPFANIFTDKPTTIFADATAAIVQDGDFCMVSLYDGSDTGIVIRGNATVTLGCGMIANSTSEDAVSAGGSSEVTARPIGSVGGLVGSTNNYVGGTVLMPYLAPQADPLGYLPDPQLPSGTTCSALDVGNGDVVVRDASVAAQRCFSSLDVKGELQLRPGTYYVYGGDVDIKGTLKSIPTVSGADSGITIIMTGANGKAGDLSSNAQAEIQITPSDSGTYKGISFYRDRRADPTEIKINGGSSSTFKGAYYFPSADLTFNGNASITATCLQMIGQKLKFSGTFDLVNTCNNGPNNGNFRRRLVRLVE